MSSPGREAVEAALAAFVEPCSGQDLASLKAVRAVTVDGDRARIALGLGFPAGRYGAELGAAVTRALHGALGITAEVTVEWQVVAHAVQRGLKPLPGIRNVIAVASGKGGVGKSTVAVNLALALADEGARVGLLDADIYGPSQPRMLGVSGHPVSKDGKRLQPMVGHGIQCMSIGFLVDADQPMVWRGPMVTQALTQLLNDTDWQDLDYLIVDMPPGTGDIQLTLAQRVPVAGAVIVTTPQDIALLDARKGLQMFRKVEVSVLGVVENMSTHICSRCGHEEHIFGAGGGARLATEYDAPFLGGIPLDLAIREQADSGRPTVMAEPDSANAQAYREVARRAVARLAQVSADHTHKFPKIVVE
jgi:ATP-binding protein involved in chromosome partitioning